MRAAVVAIAMAAGAAVAAPALLPEVAVVRVDGEVDGRAARAFARQLAAALERRPRFLVVEIDACGGEESAEPLSAMAEAVRAVPRETRTVALVLPGARDLWGELSLFAAACGSVAVDLSAPVTADGAARQDVAHRMAESLERRADGGRAVESFDPASGRFLRDVTSEPGRSARAKLLARLEELAGERLSVVPVGGAFERFLTELARAGLLPVFLFLGLLGIAVEISHPSLVFPGLLGTACLAVALSGGHVAGLTSAFDLCLVVGGIVLVILEMFVIPGFGAAGVVGILALLAGAFLALQESAWPRTEAQAAQWRDGARTFAIGLGATVGAFALILRSMPASPLLRRLVHTSAESVEDGYTVAPASRVAFLGRTGVAATDLRPSGKVAIEDEVVDAMSDGTWIARGAPVEVIETSENRLVVRKKG